MSTSHLAGTVITVQGRYVRQLCQWCGHRLVDVDLACIAVPLEDAGKPSPAWEAGAWIREDGPARRVVETEGDKMPGDACMRDVAPLVRVVEDDDEADTGADVPRAD